MRMIVSSPLLRNVLIVDAAFSGAAGVTLAAAAGPFAAMSGLPHALVLGVGVFLMPYALVVGSLGLCALPAAARLVVAGNALWVAASLAALAQTQPTSFGVVAVVGQAVVVAALAAGQAVGLRRSAPATA